MESVITADIRKSLEDIGLWPIDFRFVNTFKARKDEIREVQEELRAQMTSAGLATSLESVHRQIADKETLKLLAAIVEEARWREELGSTSLFRKQKFV